MEPVVDETAQQPTFLTDPVVDETAQQPTFLTELNTDSNLSYASNPSSADANDANSQDGSSTPATPLARKRPYRKQKGELDFLGITSSLAPASAAEGGEAGTDDKFTAEKLFEYQWPQEKGSEHWMLQEHVQEFLDIGNFKRKHPDVLKRGVEMLERDYLRENGVVTELQCDLGLTALKASEVMDLMAVDYLEKYEEYCKVLQEKEKQEMKNQRQSYTIPQVDKGDMVKFVKKAMNSCSKFNSMFLKERKEERCAYFDVQTMNLHYPKSKYTILPPEKTKPGLYPVALLPGQYQNYYKKFTAEELKYLPLTSVVHHPPRDPPSKWQDPSLIEKYSDDEEEQDNVSEDPKSESESESDEEDSKVMGKKSLKRKFDEVAKFTPPPKDPCHKCKKRALGFGPVPVGQRHSKKFAGMKELIGCTVCKKLAHPWCWEMTVTMAKIVKEYEWQCMECKTCVTCSDPHDEEKMMFCDLCDRGYHSFCVGLHDIPLGKWECPRCNESNIEVNSPLNNDDEKSRALTARPLIGRGGRGTRRARGARVSRGEIRGRGAVRGTPSKPSSRPPLIGTPKASPRVQRGGTPRGRGTRVARGGTPRGAGTPRGRGRGRGRPSLSSSPSKEVADLDDVQAAIDAVAAGLGNHKDDDDDESEDKSESSSSSSSESAEEEMTDAGSKDEPTPVPMSLVKVDSGGAKGIPIESLNEEELKKEEAQEESRTGASS